MFDTSVTFYHVYVQCEFPAYLREPKATLPTLHDSCTGRGNNISVHYVTYLSDREEGMCVEPSELLTVASLRPG